MERRTKTYALLAAFGCALAYLLAGKLLALVPAPAAGTRVPAFVHHCVAAPIMGSSAAAGAAFGRAAGSSAAGGAVCLAAWQPGRHGMGAGLRRGAGSAC